MQVMTASSSASDRRSGIINERAPQRETLRVCYALLPSELRARVPLGAGRAARLHQRIYRTSQGLGIGAAGDRARRLARIQGGIRKDKLKIHSMLLEARQLSRQLCPPWVMCYAHVGLRRSACDCAGDCPVLGSVRVAGAEKSLFFKRNPWH
jgi:hypothetical protein